MRLQLRPEEEAELPYERPIGANCSTCCLPLQPHRKRRKRAALLFVRIC